MYTEQEKETVIKYGNELIEKTFASLSFEELAILCSKKIDKNIPVTTIYKWFKHMSDVRKNKRIYKEL